MRYGAAGGVEIQAWRPRLPGVAEVLKAHVTDHAYPMHAHDTWTLLIVDDGAVRYDLPRHEHCVSGMLVTLLPPHVPHNGCSATPEGFRKQTAPVRFDTKIAVLLRDDLLTWQRLNITAFLVSGIGTRVPEVIGEPYEDASGVPYLPMFRQPVLVFDDDKELLQLAHKRALDRHLQVAVFTSELFATANDRTTGLRFAPSPPRSWTWSGWRSTVRVTRWTR